MMKKAILCILMCLMLLVPATASAAGEGLQAAEDILKGASATQFAVLFTGDLNGKEGSENGQVGFAKLRALLENTKEGYDALLLDSGNALGGDGGKTVKLMEAVGYDAAAIGTRDAALGIERLQELGARANFPLLCANWLREDGELLFDPYTIVDVGGVRVGIIGLISPEIAETYPEITAGCNVYKPSGIANIYYEEMVEKGCSYFIALTSLGFDGAYTPRHLAKESPWLNLILDGNTQTLLDMGELVEKTNVVAFNLPTDFEAVGSFIISQGTGTAMATPSVLRSEDLSELKEDKEIADLIKAPYEEPSVSNEPQQGASSGGSSFHLSSRTIFILSFILIVLLTVGIVWFMSKKNNEKKK
jgi:2',3'-cyclic-nucleotide 2'-phosphodiesterase (5'-nucleotidase family)